MTHDDHCFWKLSGKDTGLRIPCDRAIVPTVNLLVPAILASQTLVYLASLVAAISPVCAKSKNLDLCHNDRSDR